MASSKQFKDEEPRVQMSVGLYRDGVGFSITAPTTEELFSLFEALRERFSGEPGYGTPYRRR